MKEEKITIKGARTHNLKNISVDIPINKITTLYGPSGSGKSSLAFGTLYQESKRRLINSFPTDIKFFWDIPQTVEVDSISPVLPAWGLPQMNPVKGSRPTIADLTNLTERIQRFFFTLGKNCCPRHQQPYETTDVTALLKEKIKTHSGEMIHILIRKEDYERIFPGFYPARSFGPTHRPFCLEDPWWEIIRLKKGKEKSLEKMMRENLPLRNVAHFKIISQKVTDFFYTPRKKCPECGGVENVAIKNFMMLSPYHGVGACKECDGHGALLVYDRDKLVKYPERSIEEGAVSLLDFKYFRHHRKALAQAFKHSGLSTKKAFNDLPEKKWEILYEGQGKYPGFNKCFKYLESKKYKKNIRIFSRKLKKEIPCQHCQSTRLSLSVWHIRIPLGGKSVAYGDIYKKNIKETLLLFNQMRINPKRNEWKNFHSFIRDLVETLNICSHLGLDHIPLTKKVRELSPSEYQRALLVKFLSYKGSGALFIFDEPTAVLSPKEENLVLKSLTKLREQKNTVLLVSHSPSVIAKSDHVIEMGPSCGAKGGKVIYSGLPKKMPVATRGPRIRKGQEWRQAISVIGAYDGSSQGTYSYRIPTGGISLVQGESKINKRAIVAELLSSFFKGMPLETLPVKSIKSPREFQKVVSLSSALMPITSRASVGTTLGLMGYLRKHYADLPASKAMNLAEGHFSPHSSLGQCASCKGRGIVEVEMNFLENIYLTCDDCEGMKIKPLYALIRDGPLTYHKAVEMPVADAFGQVTKTPKVSRTLHYLKVLNLDYVGLDRPLSSLSGGERQRLQLLCEIQSALRESLLLLEHISFGLSPTELIPMMELIGHIRDEGNTVVIIDEHPLLRTYAQHRITL